MKIHRLPALVAAADRRGRADRLQRRHQRRDPAATRKTLTLASVDQGSIEDVVKAFEAANPGVKVNFTTAAPTSTSSRSVPSSPPAPRPT